MKKWKRVHALQKDRSIEEIDGYAENAGDLENCCIHHVLEDPDRGGMPAEMIDALGIRNDRPPEELRIMTRSEHRKMHKRNAENEQTVKQQRAALNCFKEIARWQLGKIPYDELVDKIWDGGWSDVGDSCWKILFQKEVWKEIGRRLANSPELQASCSAESLWRELQARELQANYENDVPHK